MTTPGQHDLPAKLWNGASEICEELLDTGELRHHIAIACDVERRHGYFGACVGRKIFPAPIHIAIPVQTAAETSTGKLRRVVVNVGSSEPRGQFLRVRHSTEKPGLSIHHADAGSGLQRMAQVARRVAGSAV